MSCPGFARLIDYLDGQLTPKLAVEVAAHIATGCSRCAADAAWYERVKTVAATDDTAEPPPWVLKRAVKVFESARSRASLKAALGRLAAVLIFDSRNRPELSGVRLTEASNRQLLYRAGSYTVDLQIASVDENRSRLSGQALKEGEFKFESVAGIKVFLVREEATETVVANNFGEFTFAIVADGQYDLQIEAADVFITIAGLTISQ